MKRLFAAFLLILAMTWAYGVQAQTTVSGHLKAPDGTSIAGSARNYWSFDLQSCGSNSPRVSGVASIPRSFTKQPDSTGSLSFTLYGNDSITCGSVTGATRWAVTPVINGIAGQSCIYNISGASWDLDSQLCINASPAPSSPSSSDTSHLRTDGGNQMSGNIVPTADGTYSVGSAAAKWLGNFSSITFGGVGGPAASKSADSATSPFGAPAGFLKINTGLQTSSSLQVDGGSIIISQNSAYLAMRNSGKALYLQAGDPGSGDPAMTAHTTLTFPYVAKGGTSAAVGFVLGVDNVTSAASSGHCLYYDGTNPGVMNDSGFSCNTHLSFPVNTRRVSWKNGSFTGQLTSAAITADRDWVMPDVGGTVVTDSGAQTLTNKTLDAPVITNGASFTGAPKLKTGTASNSDIAGELSFAAATTASYTFANTYTSHPECVVTPQFNPGANVYWVTYTAATSFTINFSGAVTGSVSYTCIGRN